MKVASKVAAGSGLLLVLFVGALVYHLALIRDLAAVQRELSTAKTRAAKIAFDGIRLVDELDESIQRLYATRDARFAGQTERLRRQLGDGLAELGSLGLAGAEGDALARLTAAWRELPAAPVTTDNAMSLVAPASRIHERLEELLATVEEAIERRAHESVAASEMAGRIALVVAAVALASSLVVVRLTVRSIEEPLKRLTEGTHSVAKGELAFELDTSRGDEFSELAADFNAMVRRLGELEAMKKDLLSHVSHELKTPLATLQETHQLLLEGVPGELNERQRRLLELNLKSSERLSRLISKLLDLSRLEAGAVEYELSRRDLGRIVADAAAELEPRAREGDVRVRVDLGEEPIEIDCDGDRLTQVIENLLENAIKFSPAGGAVIVRVRPVAAPPTAVPATWRWRVAGGAGALVTVSDAGPGVPEADKKKIFEKFHQAGPRRGGSVGGAGLGLAICQEIVKAHQGAIWVTDNVPAGSVFRVLLPGTAPAADLRPAPAAAASGEPEGAPCPPPERRSEVA